MRQTTNLARKEHLLDIRKGLILALKASLQFPYKNHTKDWALSCHVHDNSQMTHKV